MLVCGARVPPLSKKMSAKVAFITVVLLAPLMRRTTISLCKLLVVDFRLPDHSWITACGSVSFKTGYIQRRTALLPRGSWFTAMTAAFERMERSAGGIFRISLPMMRGDLAAAPYLG